MSFLSGLSPRAKRILTVASGVGVGLLGLVIPGAAAFTTPAAVGLVTWAVRHPADAPPAPPQ